MHHALIRAITQSLQPHMHNVSDLSDKLNRIFSSLSALFSFFERIIEHSRPSVAVLQVLAQLETNDLAMSSFAPPRADDKCRPSDLARFRALMNKLHLFQKQLKRQLNIHSQTLAHALLINTIFYKLPPTSISIPPPVSATTDLTMGGDTHIRHAELDSLTANPHPLVRSSMLGIPVIVKLVKFPRTSFGDSSFHLENLRLHTLTHDCIPIFFGAHWPDNDDNSPSPRAYIVVEAMSCSLADAREISPALERDDVRRSILCDIASALAFLHKSRVRHASLTPNNVLLRIDEDEGELEGRAKLDVTHLAIETVSSSSSIPHCLTKPSAFSAPELLMWQDEGLLAADVWSFGVLAVYLYHEAENPDLNQGNGSSVFEDVYSVCSNFAKGQANAVVQRFVDSVRDPFSKNLASACLRLRPCDRPTMAHVLSMVKSDTSDDEQMLDCGIHRESDDDDDDDDDDNSKRTRRNSMYKMPSLSSGTKVRVGRKSNINNGTNRGSKPSSTATATDTPTQCQGDVGDKSCRTEHKANDSRNKNVDNSSSPARSINNINVTTGNEAGGNRDNTNNKNKKAESSSSSSSSSSSDSSGSSSDDDSNTTDESKSATNHTDQKNGKNPTGVNVLEKKTEGASLPSQMKEAISVTPPKLSTQSKQTDLDRASEQIQQTETAPKPSQTDLDKQLEPTLSKDNVPAQNSTPGDSSPRNANNATTDDDPLNAVFNCIGDEKMPSLPLNSLLSPVEFDWDNTTEAADKPQAPVSPRSTAKQLSGENVPSQLPSTPLTIIQQTPESGLAGQDVRIAATDETGISKTNYNNSLTNFPANTNASTDMQVDADTTENPGTNTNFGGGVDAQKEANTSLETANSTGGSVGVNADANTDANMKVNADTNSNVNVNANANANVGSNDNGNSNANANPTKTPAEACVNASSQMNTSGANAECNNNIFPERASNTQPISITTPSTVEKERLEQNDNTAASIEPGNGNEFRPRIPRSRPVLPYPDQSAATLQNQPTSESQIGRQASSQSQSTLSVGLGEKIVNQSSGTTPKKLPRPHGPHRQFENMHSILASQEAPFPRRSGVFHPSTRRTNPRSPPGRRSPHDGTRPLTASKPSFTSMQNSRYPNISQSSLPAPPRKSMAPKSPVTQPPSTSNLPLRHPNTKSPLIQLPQTSTGPTPTPMSPSQAIIGSQDLIDPSSRANALSNSVTTPHPPSTTVKSHVKSSQPLPSSQPNPSRSGINPEKSSNAVELLDSDSPRNCPEVIELSSDSDPQPVTPSHLKPRQPHKNEPRSQLRSAGRRARTQRRASERRNSKSPSSPHNSQILTPSLNSTGQRNRKRKRMRVLSDDDNDDDEDGNGVFFSREQREKQRPRLEETAEADRLNKEGEAFFYGNGAVGVDRIRAFNLFKLAADKGSAAGYYNLSCCYKHGHGVEQDTGLAEEHERTSAVRGYVPAMIQLANQFESSVSETDQQASFYWHNKAAEGGEVDSLLKVATALRDGVRLNVGPGRVCQMLENASLNGHPAAQFEYAQWCEHGIGGMDVDFTKALNLYNTAAKSRNEKAMSRLVKCYSCGELGATIDNDLAQKYRQYLNSSLNSPPESYYEAGLSFEKGENDNEPDWERAIRSYKKAAERGFTKAMIRLGEIHEQGLCPSTPDKETKDRAREYYEMAADRDDSDALIKLGMFTESLAEARRSAAEAAKLFKEALQYYNKAIGKDNFLGCAKAGQMHEYGKFNKKRQMADATRMYEMGASKGNPECKALLGQCYLTGQGKPQNIDHAIQLFRDAASKGEMLALFELGDCCRTGGMGSIEQPDINQACECYLKAAQMGHAEAQMRYGECLLYGAGTEENESEGLMYMDKAIAQGQHEAYYHKGYYLWGKYDKDPQRMKEVVELFHAGSTKKVPLCMFNLGVIYENGQGVPMDKKRALNLYKKCGDLNCGIALNNAGLLFEKGEGGIKQNFKQALDFYKRGSELSSAEATTNLGDCYKNGNGVAKDPRKAVSLYRKAVMQYYKNLEEDPGKTEDGGCHVALGACLYDGDGTEIDYPEAVRLLKKAHELGEPEGTRKLALAYLEGNGVPVNNRLGLQLLNEAIHKKNDDAMVDLAKCYWFGEAGLEKDLIKAQELYAKAAEKGLASATMGFANFCVNAPNGDTNNARGVHLFESVFQKEMEEYEQGHASPSSPT